MKKNCLVIAFLFVSFAQIIAQDKGEKLPYNRWEIGINGGVANFGGSTVFFGKSFGKHINYFNPEFNFGYGVFVRKNFTHFFALEGAYNGTTLTGTPKTGMSSIRAFSTDINEFVLNTVWNMNNLLSNHKFDRKIYWYVKLGIGLTLVKSNEFTPPATILDPWRGTVPVGTGFAIRLNDNLHLDIGTQFSTVNSNSLDGWLSSERPSGDSHGYLGAQIREHYLYTHAGLTYSLGKKPKKPAPSFETTKPQAKSEPKPEPKSVPPPALPVHVTPACAGQIFNVFFAFDKWDLNPTSKIELDRLAKEMQEYPEVQLEMKSHTDSRGPASYNMKLSEKRGKSVLDYLIAKGISESRINAQAFGETELTNKCSDGVKCTESEHQANRRTETLVIE